MATVPEISFARQPRCEVAPSGNVGRNGLLNAACAHVVMWLQRVEQRRVLLTLSDEMLRDIGICRADAESEAQKWFWQE